MHFFVHICGSQVFGYSFFSLQLIYFTTFIVSYARQFFLNCYVTHHWKCQSAKKKNFWYHLSGVVVDLPEVHFISLGKSKILPFWGPVVHRRNGLPNMGPLKRLEKMNPKKVNRHFQWCVICNFAHVEKVNFFVVTDGCVQSANSPALQGDLMLFG